MGQLTPNPKRYLLTARLLLLTPQQSIQTDTVNRVDPVSCPGKIPVGFALGTADTLNLHLVVFVYEVQRPVAGQESGHDLAILDELCTDALSDRAVRLPALHTHLLQHNGTALRCPFQRVSLVVEAEHPPLIGRVSPSEALPPLPQLPPREHTARSLAHNPRPLLGRA